MPKEWHDRHSVNKIEDDDEQRELYRRIVADKKPYFMRYIYPALSKQYNTYIKNTERNALREFGMTVKELQNTSPDNLNQRQKDFLDYYRRRMPVGMNDCVMNKICRRFEEEFDGYIGKYSLNEKYDYGFMKSSNEYTPRAYYQIQRLYEDYNRRLITHSILSDCERSDNYESVITLDIMNNEFKEECSKICPNSSTLCNILLDICYRKKSTKRFAWNMCGHDIIKNLLDKNDGYISFPTQCTEEESELVYCGTHFRIKKKLIEVNI